MPSQAEEYYPNWDRYYKWDSSEGCERCKELHRYHEDEPDRPHPNCDCDVEEIEPDSDPPPVDPPSPSDYGCFHVEVEFDSHNVDDFIDDDSIPDEDDFFNLFYSYTIECWDGNGESGQIVMDMTFGELWDGNLEALEQNEDEALESVKQLALLFCDCDEFDSLNDPPDEPIDPDDEPI